MPNVLGTYNPIIYAQEALRFLHAAMGMAKTVHMGYDEERKARDRGETMQIRRPGTFTVQDAPSAAQDLAVETVTMTLSNWREVKFKLTDKEQAFTGDNIIRDHIRTAAIKIAEDIDLKLATLANNIPWFYDLNASPGSVVADITGPRKILFDNKVPLVDQANMFGMVDGALEAGLLGNSAFTQYNGAGTTGEQSQIQGSIGKRFGINWFANQQVQSHVKGTSNQTALDLVGAHVKGATTVLLDKTGGVTGTLTAGDTFVLAGNTQRYSVMNTVTASANAFPAITISPALVQDYADNTVATVSLDDHVMNLAYHREAFALVMATLPSQLQRATGQMVETVTDPVTGLSIRAAIYTIPDSSVVACKLDVLFALTALNPNLAVRLRG